MSDWNPRSGIIDKISEGDVELQKIVPLFFDKDRLGFRPDQIKSKQFLAAKDIGKGKSGRRGYIPDFCIYENSLPVLIIEAKAPGENARQAYEEACLYAHELNKGFDSGVNPCQFVFSTNGEQFFAGGWDAEPQVDGPIDDLTPGSKLLSRLTAAIGRDATAAAASAATTQLRKHRYRRPGSLGSAPTMLDSKIEPNTFAADLAPTLRRYFASKDQNDDPEIYDKAYISSTEVTSYDRILESFLKDRTERLRATKELKTTRKSANEVSARLREIKERRSASGELQLITGSVGAGKSLFARRYKELLLPDDLRTGTHWSFIDFNEASSLGTDAQEWVCSSFVESLLREGAPINLRDPEDQERVFASDLADRKAYYDRREKLQNGAGELEKARDLEGWRQDPLKAARGCARYLQGDRRESIIAVFDNVDRRDTTEQLIAFQLALWFMAETRALVLLQMRDATFEAHKNEPPLDTYKTGQIFHVSPPRFVDVVRRRLELALEAFGPESQGTVSYTTTRGVTVTYPKARAGDFLRQVYHEVFQTPKNISVILESLAGRNVRKSLDMFMAIITSGHMPEEMISAVTRGESYGTLQEWVLIRVLMRQDYRFFNDHSGFIHNIFDCSTRAARPSNFIRIEILFYLIGARKRIGENGLLGFVARSRIEHRLEHMGFVVSDVRHEMDELLEQGLIESDTFTDKSVSERASLRANASAWAHLRILPSRIEYASSVLPTTPIADEALVARVSSALTDESRVGGLSLSRRLNLLVDFRKYLVAEHERLMAHPGFANIEHTGAQYVIGKITEAIEFARGDRKPNPNLLDLLDT